MKPGIFSLGRWRTDVATQHHRSANSGQCFFGRPLSIKECRHSLCDADFDVSLNVTAAKTFESFKGGPSGEDQHVLWIAPDDPQRMFLGSDQGAIISVDGGRTWTNGQSTDGQMYHVATDNEFPYRLYASQQDSGSVAVLSRSDFGMITIAIGFSTGSFESGYIRPDPVNRNLVYSVGWYGSVLRMDRTTGQIATVFAPGANYRYTWRRSGIFAARSKALYVGMQSVLRTTDEGKPAGDQS